MTTNDNDLIERYLYAITRRLPANQRADVAEELRTLISDMLEERCGPLPPTVKDVRVVLTELGTPGEMVRKYTDREGACLIGQPYYSQYVLVLKIVLACVAGGIAVAGLISLATGSGEGPVAQGAHWVGTLVSSLAYAFAFVTVIFAVFSRKGVQVEVMGSLDDLPSVPRETKLTTRGDAVAGIVFSLAGAMVFLVFPDVLNALGHRSDGAPLEIFNVDAIRASAWLIVAWTVACVAGESFKLVEGRYTPRLLVATIVTDALGAALVIFWLSSYTIVDAQQLIQFVGETGANLNGIVLASLENVQAVFCGLVVVALVIDAIDAAVRTYRAR